MSRRFGLIGYPLTHSFSKKYFTQKFQEEHISGCSYELFEMADAAQFPKLFEEYPELQGINVTIPHKKTVIPFLNRLDPSASRVGAVNVITLEKDGTLTGHNSDYFGFKKSLESWVGGGIRGMKALVLGSGGAASAVKVALEDLNIDFWQVSRSEKRGFVTYADLMQNWALVTEAHLIVNTTPLGTYPKVDTCPDIPFDLIGEKHFLYDLVYNPEETQFMKMGAAKGAMVKNGYEMLVLQAERAWEIWNQKS